MNFTPTAEQTAIVKAAVETKDNILISALAGAAKTSTLALICEALPGQPILSLAFNKRIAEEMSKKLPDHVSASTINSLGHRAWSAQINKRLVVNTKKSYEILKEEVERLKGRSKSEAYETFTETLHAISRAKLNGYIPEGKYPEIKRVVSLTDFMDSFDEGLTSGQLDLIDTVLARSIKQGYDGQIDFDDQIYLPSLFSGVFPRFPTNLVDEAQDLSPLNMLFLQKLVGDRRIIAVGDSHQSIYAFRSASTQSMQTMKFLFSMTEMTLSTSFRCPIEIVKLVRKHTPTMQWADWAAEGHIETLTEWDAASIPDSAAIICRNNAPLMKLAYRLLRAQRGIKLVGTDLGPQLAKAFKKLGPESMTQREVLDAIDNWEKDRLRKSKAKASIQDKADCLRVFAGFGPTMSAAIAYVEKLFASGGSIQLLSGHKAKGLEWDVVYHLDSWRIPSKWAESDEDLQQERNLDYVISTRSKDQLYFVNLEDMK